MTVTLVPEALAEEGSEFYYVGQMDGCAGCRLERVCYNLDEGHRYRVTEVRDQSHGCPQLGDERVVAVSVEVVVTPGAVPKKEAMEGVTFTYTAPRCGRIGCPNFRLCHIPGTEDGDKRTVVRLGGELECPAGERMVDADVLRRPYVPFISGHGVLEPMKIRNIETIALAAVVITICLLFSFVTFEEESSESRFDYELVPITEDMLEWMTPDEARDLWDAAVSAYLEASETEGEDMGAALQALNDAYIEVIQDYMMFEWSYSRDPSSCSEYYADWTTIIDSLSSSWDDALMSSLHGPNADAVRAIIGDDEAERILSSESLSDYALGLLSRESELENMLLTGEGDVYEVYLEIVDVRNAIAEYYGYENYIYYAYAEIYHRDYDPDDTAAVREQVKGILEALHDLYAAVDREALDSLFTYTEQDELLSFVEPFIDSICPEFAEAYDYMLEYGLIDAENLDTKIDSSFTNAYVDLTYIFIDPSMDCYDVSTLVHEFGHAAHFILTEGTSDYDIMEIHSQGLEALLAVVAADTFGDEWGVMSDYLIFSLSFAVLAGFCIDEFEQRVYSGEAVTAEELDRLFAEISAEYGNPYSTWQFFHLFSEPGYYISYAASAFSSLGIFLDGLDDWDTAVDEYLDVVGYTGSGYIQMTETLGMLSMFDADDVGYVIDALLGYTQSL